MRKLLWIGDAACDSGFAKCTHETLKGFLPSWDTAVLGLNYRGDPHAYPYDIYPASTRGDMFGVRRVLDVVKRESPDVAVIQNDPWNIPAYVAEFDKLKKRPFLVGAIAVDGKNCRGKDLNGLDHAIFWTQFAEAEARKGGFTGDSSIVPLGVDLTIYGPGDRAEARRKIFEPQVFEQHAGLADGFYFLNVNRNQPRKRLDLTVEYFAEFYHKYHAPDAYLYLHVCPTGDMGYDLNQLAGYYGLKGHVILVEPGVYHGSTEAEMALTYQACNAQISTTQGEGWGLTTLEGMACGLPQIVPDWSALGDWAADAAMMVPCTSTAVTPNNINVIGGVPNRESFVTALGAMYLHETTRAFHLERGLALAEQPQYRWENIAASFAAAVNTAYWKRPINA